MIGRLRLISGLVLFIYVTTHLLNHALGLYSLDAMRAALVPLEAVWRSPPGTVALYGALLTHVVLVLYGLYRRRDLRMPAREVVQVVMGLSVPLLLAGHAIPTRGLAEFLAVDDGYDFVLLNIWVFSPRDGIAQALLTGIVWLHGCLGLYAWLRLKPWFRAWAGVLFAVALLVPVLALLGFVEGGRTVARFAAAPGWIEATLGDSNLPTDDAIAAAVAFADFWTNVVVYGTLALIAVVIVGRQIRSVVDRWRGLIEIAYPGGRQVKIERGTSVLEASRRSGVPHASVCGGRGRCSTCRVRVGWTERDLPPPSAEEERVLRRISAPPNVRLACQLRPVGDLDVTPLLPVDSGAERGHAGATYRGGSEREIAILFADLRSFTRFAEQKLPYDVVFVLNRYFATMGAVVERCGGHLDKFIGDGVMALFGLDVGIERGCLQALAAARGMAEELGHLNTALAHDLDSPLRLGIGIHAGPTIVGEMGYARTMSITAVGDAVNIASRMETMTKDFGAQLVVSEDTARRAGVDLSRFPTQKVDVRGRTEAMTVRVITVAADLPEIAL
ncbi:MAG: adenylate/guanylate cyclase domain-containing protein [Alphaproteobacteria bacterium]|nr:adenylate/guanylate cyclase domain-containing protein [Alphaproteobacteria bacterium]